MNELAAAPPSVRIQGDGTASAWPKVQLTRVSPSYINRLGVKNGFIRRIDIRIEFFKKENEP
jgi:hypothetical protein